jgi:hypothetical protein
MSRFTGARVDGAEYFDDIADRNDAGIYAGAGVDDYEGLKETVGPEGMQITMNCRKCNKQHQVTLEWQELFLVGNNGPGKSPLVPTGWAYSPNNHDLYPKTVRCSKCAEPLCPHVTPQEARDRVNDAASRGLIPREALAQWTGQVNAYRAQNG